MTGTGRGRGSSGFGKMDAARQQGLRAGGCVQAARLDRAGPTRRAGRMKLSRGRSKGAGERIRADEDLVVGRAGRSGAGGAEG